MSVKMEQVVKTAVKKVISALVCIMMVAATFPVHMLNSAVFAAGSEEHVSSVADLQEAVYSAQGETTIIVDCDITVEDSFPDACENPNLKDGDEDSAYGYGYDYDYDYDYNGAKHAFPGYYLSDDSSVEKSITIKSKNPNAPVTISSKKITSGLFALQNGTLTLENVIIDGLGETVKGEKNNYIHVMEDSVLKLGQGSLIKNVYRKYGWGVLFIENGNLEINGGYIEKCTVTNSDGCVQGGAVSLDGGTMKMNSGGIVDCCALTGLEGSYSFGGGICALNGSSLHLHGGIITGCRVGMIDGNNDVAGVKLHGDAIYFEAGDGAYGYEYEGMGGGGNGAGEYDVAPPNGHLKINIPAGYVNAPYNSDGRILGYQGIYKTDVPTEVDDDLNKVNYYEVLIDVDGGLDENGYHPGNAVYIDKNATDLRVLNYLPSFVKKGDFVLTEWDKDGTPVTEDAKVADCLKKGSQTRTDILKAIYGYIEVITKINGEEKPFNVLTTKDINATNKFALLYKDKCTIEISPTNNSKAISKIYCFKSSTPYVNVSDLNKNANWSQEMSNNSGCFSIDLNRSGDSEKFFAYFKIVGGDGSTKYLRSDGIVLYNAIGSLSDKIVYSKSTYKDVSIDLNANQNKFNKLIKFVSANKKIEYSNKYFNAKNEGKNFNMHYTVFYLSDPGSYNFKVLYMPGCCEASDFVDSDALPSFSFDADIRS